MKRSILIISLMTVVMAAFAINYPTYKPNSQDRQLQGQATMHSAQGQPIGGYSTVATGGTTTFGEGSAIAPYGGPNKTNWGTNDPQDPQEGDHKFENGQWWLYLNGDWVMDGNYHPTDAGDQSDQAPIGSPIVMLLFAAMAAAVIAVRRHRALAVVALLFVCGQGWAYEIVDNGNSGYKMVFKAGDSFTLVLPENAMAYGFNNLPLGANNSVDIRSVAVVDGVKTVTVEARSDCEISEANSSGLFHWQVKNGENWTWQHGNISDWYTTVICANIADNGTSFPIPTRNDMTTLTITVGAGGNAVFTWSGGAPAPGPDPVPGDHKIDGCDGCFLVEE